MPRRRVRVPRSRLPNLERLIIGARVVAKEVHLLDKFRSMEINSDCLTVEHAVSAQQWVRLSDYAAYIAT